MYQEETKMLTKQEILNLISQNKITTQEQSYFGCRILECYVLRPDFENKLVLCIEYRNTGIRIIRDEKRMQIVQINNPNTQNRLIRTIEKHHFKQEEERRRAEYQQRRQELLKQIDELDKEWELSHSK